MIYKSEFLNILHDRGFIHQGTDIESLDALLSKEKITAYSGFDCTAPSLHVGNLVQIMLLHWFQKCGHKPIVLLGGATTKIGDPSGKDESRPLLTNEVINKNMQSIRKIFDTFITFGDAAGNAMLVNNSDWIEGLNYISLLRDYGRHFSVNRMISMDSVKLRLERETEMSFLEFNYMIIQAYDFVHLNDALGCRLQTAGADQWGNIVNGVELHRRLMAKKNEGKQNIYEPIFGLTTPLITTASGAKMGKTASGAVWLNADMLSPYDYWQFWRNTEDADVGKFLRFFTELSLDEIQKLEQLRDAEINEAKKILANEATKLCHGKEAAELAAETARKTFEEGTAGDNLKTVLINKAQLAQGIPASELFLLVGLRASKGEAKKLIEGGGGRVNDQAIIDPKTLVTEKDLTAEGYIKLSAGKKQHLLLKLK